jgi:hypothetical protein
MISDGKFMNKVISALEEDQGIVLHQFGPKRIKPETMAKIVALMEELKATAIDEHILKLFGASQSRPQEKKG